MKVSDFILWGSLSLSGLLIITSMITGWYADWLSWWYLPVLGVLAFVQNVLPESFIGRWFSKDVI